MRSMTVLSIGILLLGAGCSKQSAPEAEPAPLTSETVAMTADSVNPEHRWAVSSANPLATDAGAKILEQGGSAVDAAVAVQSVLGLVEPQSSGLGGGAFMIYYDAAEDKITAYDGREVAPASARPDMFLLEDGTPMPFYDAVMSGKSVGIPGAVALLEMTHEAHGKMPWATLFADAERLATDGFEISPRLHHMLARFDRFSTFPTARKMYYGEDGKPLPIGTLFKNPAYADTVKQIMEGGADAFYNGPIADGIISVVNERTGEETLTREDFAAYAPTVRPNVCGEFYGFTVCSMGPPSSGGVTVLQILGLFERSLRADMMPRDEWARYVEASRLAYADRDLYLADPIAMGGGNVTADDIVRGLISSDYLDARSALIGDHKAEVVEPGDPVSFLDKLGKDASPDLPGTSHFSVMDSEGNIVSMTTTVEFVFGSHLISGGMILNNQLTDFSFLPTRDGKPVANAVAPGKKPRSSMSPVIVVENGKPVLAIGSPGGPAIIGYVAKTLVAALYYDMPLQEAVAVPNLVYPRGQVLAEETLAPDVMEALTAYGFEVTTRELTSGLHGFRLREDGSIEGAADPRREGTFRTGTVTPSN